MRSADHLELMVRYQKFFDEAEAADWSRLKELEGWDRLYSGKPREITYRGEGDLRSNVSAGSGDPCRAGIG